MVGVIGTSAVHYQMANKILITSKTYFASSCSILKFSKYIWQKRGSEDRLIIIFWGGHELRQATRLRFYRGLH